MHPHSKSHCSNSSEHPRNQESKVYALYWDVHSIFWSYLFKPLSMLNPKQATLQLVGGKDDEATQAKLYLVDLAGSERVKDSAATGGAGDAGDAEGRGDAAFRRSELGGDRDDPPNARSLQLIRQVRLFL